jgi:3-oxoacyl-(acyl-carrier-protein) synthase
MVVALLINFKEYNMTDKNRVVVTGFGIICAIGNDNEEFLDSLKKGSDGVKENFK